MKTKVLHNRLEQINGLYTELMGHYQVLLGDTEKIAEIAAGLVFEGENPNLPDASLASLHETLEHRQKIMQQVDTVKNDSQPLEAEVQAILHLKNFDLAKIIQLASTPIAHQLAEKQQQMTELLLRIAHLDQANQKLLAEKLVMLGQVVHKLNRGKIAREGYGQNDSISPESRFFDERK